MTEERTAVYYGQVELIPGVICDGYVLNDGTAVMSERGTANLLGMDQKTLKAMRGNWPPKTLNPFISNDFIMRGNFVKVTTRSSPYFGRNIVVYTSATIETLIRTYALAFINDGLRENQIHIGKRSVALLISLVRAALEAAIREACGLPTRIQETIQQHYIDGAKLLKEYGFTCSVSENIFIKKDLIKFLGVTPGKLNGHFRKHRDHIKPIPLNRQKRHAAGSNASHLNGYHIDDAVKIALSMDSVVGIELKKALFGQIGCFAQPYTSDEIQWEAIFSRMFTGFDFYHNYPMGKYRVDFFVPAFMLVLECNGYCHRHYHLEKEKERERFIIQRHSLVRFDHGVSVEMVINGILQAKPGKIIRLHKDSDCFSLSA
jgi:very-short-patch-repair endonuclease